MPIASIAPAIERIKFFDGQRLFASDLQFLEQFNREMRWLHNQSLHQAGIGSGFAVFGNKGDREVRIEPGYAIDSSGREIVLTQPQVLQVPPVANDTQGNPVYYDLAVSYQDDSLLKESETRDGVCVSRSAVRYQETPVFCWVELVPTGDPQGPTALAAGRQAKLQQVNADLDTGKRIRLARAEVLNCKLNQPLVLTQRRNAKPAVQPYLFAGSTNDEKNDWSVDVTGFGITITLDVNTTAASFRATPRYTAHVIGSRQVAVTLPGTAEKQTLILDGFPRVETDDASKIHFQLSLLIPQMLIDSKLKLTDVAQALKTQNALEQWYVEWLGMEG
ncbi:MAG: hypothetical protein QOH65_689 [Methylobacteriaceae bacterium]|jgi:hypothetical protein|nr:hypothetical protein [Methylobacteriaceae bacterium]